MKLIPHHHLPLKTLLILLLTLAFGSALIAQAPAPTELIPPGFKWSEYAKLLVPIPPGTKNLLCSTTINAPDYKAMPLAGYGMGVWFQFQNDAGEPLKANGQPDSKTGKVEGFPLGVERKTTRAKTGTKTVPVPPGATKLSLEVRKYSQGGFGVSAPGDFTVEAVSVKPAP
jgi:hypothetical protein